jgi:hypothetical protein
MALKYSSFEEQVNRSVVRILLAKERVYPGLINNLYNHWVKNSSKDK